ncbi:GyrI-like domain-containing protein [Staphylococcus carnosus]|nr:GyrI-like domain-containing protein [Staphylococcus carnosus]
MNYLIAVTSDKKSVADLHPYTLPEGDYIVADAIGPLPYTLQKTTEQLYNPNFLSDLGYRHRDAPGIELYPHGNTQVDDYVAQVWVPIEN